MTQRQDVRRLIELAYDYVSAMTEQQVNQIHDQAAKLATEETTFQVWLDLIEYMEAWNSSGDHKESMGRASALQFFLTRQAELDESQTKNQ